MSIRTTFGRRAVAAALAASAPFVAAAADFTVPESTMLQPVQGRSTPPAVAPGQYRKLTILSSTFLLPNEMGAQGPIRSEGMNNPQEESDRRQHTLNILDSTFYLP